MKTIANKKELGYEDVKAMAFYFFETLSRLANNSFTEEQKAQRIAKNQPMSLMQAIAEIITPDDIMGKDIRGEDIVIGHKPNKYQGSYKCYSQRAFDEGNCGDPYEYAGLQITFRLKSGINITIDTKYANIRAQLYSNKYDVGMGRKLCKELDDLGIALWADWDDDPDGLIKKLRETDSEDDWYSEDYLYMKAETSPDPANVEIPREYSTKFQRDVEGGVKYTDREWDGVSGLYVNREMYAQIIADQRRMKAEYEASKKRYPIKPPSSL